MVTQTLDQAKAEGFAARMLDVINGSSLAMMTSIGHQVGLFDAMAGLPPATSEEIARAAGLNERYVREWLGAMATAGIVDYDTSRQLFTLPAEHAVCLTGTSSRNLAPGAQFLTMLAPHVAGVARCFREGGGVPYLQFMPDFTEVADASWRLLYDGLLVKGFLPAVKGLPERLEQGIRVADLGCGTGHAINVMARQYPNSTFVGYDLDQEGISRGTAEAAEMGLRNARFQVLDVTQLPGDAEFDLVTSFDSIHDQRDPATTLRRVADVLAPGGVYVMVEPKASSRLEDNIGDPFAPYLYGVSVLHCLTVSLAERGLGLGTPWGEQTARRMLEEAGFTSIEVVDAPGPQNSIFICRL